MVQYKDIGPRCNVGFTPQTCWAIGQNTQINRNKLFLETHDFEEYTIGGSLITFRGIKKIPKQDYPELEKTFIIVPYNYYGVEYIVIRRRPTI